MHHLLVAAAFALILVTPYMQVFPKQDDTTIEAPDETLESADEMDDETGA